MANYFSPSTKLCYDTDIDYPSLPDDIIEVSAEKHIEIIDNLNNNKRVVIVDNEITYTDAAPLVISTWSEIRAKRNRLISRSDYTQMPDWPGDKEAWAAYRQQLRDIPQIYSKPELVEFPTPPGA